MASLCSCSFLKFGTLLEQNPVINTVLYLYIWHNSHLMVKCILEELLVREQGTSYLELAWLSERCMAQKKIVLLVEKGIRLYVYLYSMHTSSSLLEISHVL